MIEFGQNIEKFTETFGTSIILCDKRLWRCHKHHFLKIVMSFLQADSTLTKNWMIKRELDNFEAPVKNCADLQRRRFCIWITSPTVSYSTCASPRCNLHAGPLSLLVPHFPGGYFQLWSASGLKLFSCNCHSMVLILKFPLVQLNAITLTYSTLTAEIASAAF